MPDRLDELREKLEAGALLTYDDAAELFRLTVIGSTLMASNGLTSADIIARLKAKFGSEGELTAWMAGMLHAYQAHINKQGGQGGQGQSGKH